MVTCGFQFVMILLHPKVKDHLRTSVDEKMDAATIIHSMSLKMRGSAFGSMPDTRKLPRGAIWSLMLLL